jgi:hypothetical protein
MKKSTWVFLVIILVLVALIVYGLITQGFR